jgi:hypothetical protein
LPVLMKLYASVLSSNVQPVDAGSVLVIAHPSFGVVPSQPSKCVSAAWP